MNIAAQALLSSADAGDNGRRSLPRRLLDFVFGYDFFISYSWSDGAAYASALVSRLEADGFQVFLDRASYASGDDARVWNAGTGEVIAVLERHRKTVWSAAFDPDGGRVVTAQRPLKLGILPACATTSCKARSCERSSPREQLSVRNDDWLLWNIQPDGTVEEPHKAKR